MPALPVLLIVAELAAPELIAAAGATILETVGATAIAGEIGLSAATVGTAALSGVGTLAAGGSAEDALKSALVSGVGSFVGGRVSNVFADPTAQAAFQAGMPGGTQVGTSVFDPSKIAGATAGGAARGGTQALLSGQNIGEGVLKGAGRGAISGVAGSLGKYASSQVDDPLGSRVLGGAVTGATQTGLSGQNPLIGALAGAAGGGAGYLYGQATDTNVPLSFDQQVSNLIRGNATPSGTTGTSPVSSSVTTGSPAPSTAATGADIAMLDTSTPDSVGGKLGKKGGKYPWGTPEGTTALKEGLGV
jgi:hypothetical protein